MDCGGSPKQSSAGFGSRPSLGSSGGDGLAPPELCCGCVFAACKKKSRTPRNPERYFFMCGSKQGCTCNTWIWADLVMEYVEAMVEYCTRPLREEWISAIAESKRTLERTEDELDAARREMHELFRRASNQIRDYEAKVSLLERRSRKMMRFRLLVSFPIVLLLAAPAAYTSQIAWALCVAAAAMYTI